MIRVSIDKHNDKKLAIRFKYDADIVAKIKTITGARYVNKKDDKHWTIDYFKIQNLIETFGEEDMILEPNVDVNYKPSEKYNFAHELELFSDSRFATFGKWCLSKAPEKFFIEPAAYYASHHPSYAHGEGGTARHTAAAMRVCYSFKDMTEIPDEDMDIALLALLIHDFGKYGHPDNISEKILFEHPIISAEIIENAFKEEENPCNELLYVYNKYWDKIKKAVRSHMGRFNKKEGHETVLPTPTDKISKLVHECDYIVSRNFIEINFQKKLKPSSAE